MYSIHPELAADENAIYSDLLVDYYDDLREAQKSVIFEGWKVASEKEVINKNGDRLCFFGSRVFYDIHIGNQEYQGNYLKDNPNLADLAAATQLNPLKLK